MKEIANFLFEVGMLNKTPRTGFQFLGSGKESVAEHILRTLFIGYSLCKLDPSVDELKVLRMCLVHDLPEARTGDMNYMYKKYVTVDEEKAVRELTENLPFGDEIKSVLAEFNGKKTRESLLAHDADQLGLILLLKEYGDLGNKYSREWLDYAVRRLCTDEGRKLADTILRTDWTQWWFRDKSDWWVNGNRK
ncbi:MAG: HD domain-containing protein [Pseudomonadota bacterium]|jgi:putative hydrolase of HD superfamily|nr:HD domain-containing protein [Syntrophaceae bacterium]MDI9556019.1 HD domain-containing protein [Pseudomonadota bacterium]NLX30301.1 HD domain-containing protein [Deltaproteobacteria bacterium]HNU84847.1 HD domain-containing protein [Syntrophales bacterium]HNZ34063.1 HD domain-containing protein [Syntrophales bacterium]